MSAAGPHPVDDRQFSREETTFAGWPARVTTYAVLGRWVCVIDDVDPGAAVARGRGATRDEAVERASAAAAVRFAATRRFAV